MDVGDWLQSLGLGQYEAVFRQSEIDGEVVPELTDQHLKDLGVSLGHRLKILRAIRTLDGTAPSFEQPTVKLEPKAHDTVERRQLTVMFCDLVGSTAMSARLDPEDMRGIIGAYHKCCANLIERNGGYVAKYMGDGVLAYFGYPQAHEHDAERAVRAGLAIVEAAPKLQTAAGAPLQVRAGIATGIVVVGDLLGSGEAQERGVVGDTPNLAARLQAIAAPDSVVIGEGTRRLLGDLFDVVDLCLQDLKGITGLTRAYVALKESSRESRFEALHAGRLTALVGREEESELLLRRWAKANSGEGQIVLLSGEAGIGKSRLTAEFLQRLSGEPHQRLRYFCSPQHMESALYPIISQLERAALIGREDDTRTKLDKLDALLAGSATSREDASLLAEMLSLPNDGRYPAVGLGPQLRRQKTMEALVDQVEVISRQSPVLTIFEDTHWADPSSLELLGRLVDKIADLRVLLFVTFRPEFAAPWIGRPHVTALTINRLSPREVTALIEQVAGNRSLPANIRQDIVERADGIPLFVEEMTKAVLEVEGEGGTERAVPSIPLPALAVPASLHGSLMARLDRLGNAKAVAQIGAAIGREFSHGLLAAVARETQTALDAALDRLVQAGLLHRQGSPPEATYLFRHALVQDAAYGSLLREPRRTLHARLAEAIESQFLDIKENQPELLAWHFTEAGLVEKAASMLGKAGQRLLARSALVEAETQFKRALMQIAELPGTPTLRREQIALQIGIANALMHTIGFAAPEAKEALEQARASIERAEARGEPAEDPLALFTVLWGFCVTNFVAFNGKALRGLSVQFLALAEKQGATVPLMLGHRIEGISLLFTGNVADARVHLDRAVALYDPDEHRRLAMRFGGDTRAAVLCFRSWASWLLGYPGTALADADRALKDAREIGQAVTVMYGLLYASLAIINCGDFARATAHAHEAVALAEEKGLSVWKAYGRTLQGCVLALTGEASDAVHTIRCGITALQSTGTTMQMPMFLTHLALAYARLDQFDDARGCIEEAMAAAEAGEKWNEADTHRIAGEIALLSPEHDAVKAQVCFERALEIARAQQAKSWELRAATSLARLWRDQSKLAEAHALLTPVYDWFTEGFDTSDLKEAKALLEKLA
jgi:class 3 adenylate cyclase/predicted ATPase